MAEGTIKRLTDKGFGFIDTGTSQDMFFHSSNVEGVGFDDLREGRIHFRETPVQQSLEDWNDFWSEYKNA